MSNIRTLSDYPSNKPNAQPFPNAWDGEDQQQQHGQRARYSAVHPQFSAAAQQQSQMSEFDDTFWSPNLPPEEHVQFHHLLLNACCPCCVGNPCSEVRKYDYKNLLSSFIFWITIVDIIYFIIEVSIGGFVSPSQNWSLGPGSNTLLLLGAKNTYWIKYYGQVYRLVIPIIMHSGIIHLALNMAAQLLLGLGYEKNWHTLRMVIIYVLSGIGGNLLSCCVMVNTVSVGASGAIMGMFGAKVSNILCRWNSIPMSMKVMHLSSIGFMLLITFAFSFNTTVDWAGHLGGLVIGALIGLILFSNHIGNRAVKIIVLVASLLLTFSFFVTTILVIYLVLKPDYVPIA